MQCLRSGFCCVYLSVVIVIDPKKGINSDNIRVKETGEICPHLKGSGPGDYFCNIHDYDWFVNTPCGEFTQIEDKDSPCRLGTARLRMIGTGFCDNG